MEPQADGKLTCGLGHLLSIQQEVAVGADGAWPFAGVILPDRCVVVQREAQMIVDQVLA